jgi:hypothetical protein
MTMEIGFLAFAREEMSIALSSKRHRCPQIASREWEVQETSLSSIREGGGTPKGAPCIGTAA